MTTTVDTSIHRALDRAFAAAPASAEAQDLKEEVRASLMARAADLEAAGAGPADAARTALAEIGDLRDVVAAVANGPADDEGHAALLATHRVRPRPAFVVRVSLAAVVLAGAAALVALVATGVLGWSLAAGAALAAVAGLATGAVVADSLRQETTQNYPLPAGRALGFGAAGAAVVAALGLGGLFAAHLDRPWLAAVAGVLLVAGVLGFVVLGVTQTNRHKPWTVELGRQAVGQDRFTREPEAAARFGIYSGALGLVAVLAFVVLTMTVGIAWSWLALVGGMVVHMVLLARMLFPAAHGPAA
ncbi:permease prefix domain 1-containing protein [Cellulomonas sp. ACRRI]|uniref:permease prefix domain 1-containing protein n=1 Tax=Cellulomonas sp. ACRRI TaxID=2918188 RepID=UPI001EF1DFAF|nr:permease prefix domain 1-containing protein [Cellulomonas sp. ACRRI]MCG7285888.1 permease prefix domain 1-containing protein [Cellulomonas sp. ACRRI]